MDSIIPPVVLSVVSLVSNMASTARNAQEVAKKSGDSDLKAAISDLYSDILDVKARVLELDDENRALRTELARKGSITYTPELGYYFVADDPVPYCPKCYEGKGKLIHLPASQPWSYGIRRVCRECTENYWEKPMQAFDGTAPPRSWMS